VPRREASNSEYCGTSHGYHRNRGRKKEKPSDGQTGSNRTCLVSQETGQVPDSAFAPDSTSTITAFTRQVHGLYAQGLLK
jgi:hypothetical protein